MKARAIRKDATPAALIGRVLCHDVRDADRKVAAPKGALIDEALARTLLALPWEELHVIEVEAGDLLEEPAGKRLAAAVVGEGVEVKAYSEGKWSLVASRRGLFRVRTDRLRGVNALEGICVYTLYDGLPVEPGEVVARCKITPLVIAGSTIETIERLAAEAKGLLTVDAFQALTIGAVAREGLDEKQRARFEKSLHAKVAWFGARLLPVRYAGPAVEEDRQEPRAEPGDLRVERLLEPGALLLVRSEEHTSEL